MQPQGDPFKSSFQTEFSQQQAGKQQQQQQHAQQQQQQQQGFGHNTFGARPSGFGPQPNGSGPGPNGFGGSGFPNPFGQQQQQQQSNNGGTHGFGSGYGQSHHHNWRQGWQQQQHDASWQQQQNQYWQQQQQQQRQAHNTAWQQEARDRQPHQQQQGFTTDKPPRPQAVVPKQLLALPHSGQSSEPGQPQRQGSEDGRQSAYQQPRPYSASSAELAPRGRSVSREGPSESASHASRDRQPQEAVAVAAGGTSGARSRSLPRLQPSEQQQQIQKGQAREHEQQHAGNDSHDSQQTEQHQQQHQQQWGRSTVAQAGGSQQAQQALQVGQQQQQVGQQERGRSTVAQARLAMAMRSASPSLRGVGVASGQSSAEATLDRYSPFVQCKLDQRGAWGVGHFTGSLQTCAYCGA